MQVQLLSSGPARPARCGSRAWLALPLALAGFAASPIAHASSHREAPFITTAPKVDGTDFYLFQSYEPGRAGYTTLIADYLPLQDAYGGPNYFSLDPNALYEIHIDNNGDAKEDISFQFRFTNTLKDMAVPVGGQNTSIPYVTAVGPVSAADASRVNVAETFTLDVVRGGRRGTRSAVTDAASGARVFGKPLDYLGQKTFGSDAAYAAYASQFVRAVNIPGCSAGPARVFVGQRKDPFVVALGQVFDQYNLNPVGSPTGNPDKLADKNVTSIALEVPTACLVGSSGDPVIGGWTTASLRQARLLNPKPTGNNRAELVGSAWSQVSRLGMPLVNELVIGLKDKDRFNASQPKDDGQFAAYVTNPSLPTVLQSLFNVPAPTNFPRQDVVATFLTGIKGLNQPRSVTASEMLRLNTSIAPTAAAAQKNLGVLAGDNAGFPNGRRPGDDVVDAALRVSMGVLCTLNAPTVFGCVPADAKAGNLPYTDGASVDASYFTTSFPYLKPPVPGAWTAN